MTLANRLRLSISALVVVSCVQADAADFKPLQEQLRKRIHRTVVERRRLPSAAIGLALDGKIVWEEAFGLADVERKTPADVHTLYSLASVSKPFTATGLMVLVHAGLVELGRPVDEYLAPLSLRARVGKPGSATVRQLANHSSGLPTHFQFFYADEKIQTPPREASIRKYGFLAARPGERYQYSNHGYGILDHLISRQSGRPFADFMRDQVFRPLGMTNTAVGRDPKVSGVFAVRYEDRKPLPDYETDHAGASDVWASVHDLLRFGIFHCDRRLPGAASILPREYIEEMQRPTASIAGDPERAGYGVGWAIARHPSGVKVVQHSGGMPGVNTNLVLVPERRIVLVALANASNSFVFDWTRTLLEGLLGGERPKTAESKKPAPKPPFAAGPELLGEWEGTVSTDDGTRKIEVVFQNDGDVHVRLRGRLWSLLNDASFKNGVLSGVLLGDVDSPDSNRGKHALRAELRLADGRLQGTLFTLPNDHRLRAGLSFWTELSKKPKSPAAAGAPPANAKAGP